VIMLKRIFQTVVLTTVALSCYQKNLGPKTDVTDNGADGRWELSAYFVRGQRRSNTDVAERVLLQIEKTDVHPDSTYPSSIYEKGHSYRVFRFSDITGSSESKIMAISYGHDYSKKRKEETHWFRLDNEYGFQVVLNLEDGKSTRMEVSNVMKSGDIYRTELDTARYIYVPN
jgi:hypothetical protein